MYLQCCLCSLLLYSNFLNSNQFSPLDTPGAMDAFLGYWKPNAIVILENELWPNLIMDSSRKGVSLSLPLQARGLILKITMIYCKLL